MATSLFGNPNNTAYINRGNGFQRTNIRTGDTILGMYNLEQRNQYGSTIESKFNMFERPPIISEEVLTVLKEDYLDKILCKNKFTNGNYNSNLNNRIGSFQKLMVIMREFKNLDTHSNYDILITEVMTLFTSLIYKSQSQYVKIKLLERKFENAENLLNIKNQEIEYLKTRLRVCEGNLDGLIGFSGTMSFETATLPNQLIFLMHIDIVKAWYYYIFGKPTDCDMLDPDNVNYVFSYLGDNFTNLEEAKNGLRNALNN